MSRWRLIWGAALFAGACSTGGEDTTGVNTFGSDTPGATSGPGQTTGGADTTSAAPQTSSTTGGALGTSSSGAGVSGDAPIFDVATQPDAPPVEKECPEDAFMANDMDECAIDPVIYERDAGLLTLTIVLGQLFEITDPAVEVIFATEQMGYEGFFTVAREMAAPDVFYMIVSDDDFMQAAVSGSCGVEPVCETECIPGPGGDVCRAFVDDFIPIVANAYVGSPYAVDTFGRRSSPSGACCADDFMCNFTVDTYTEYVVTGPSGTMHFIFQDGFAFLDRIGWAYTERKVVSGDAEFEFDLCSLPVPEG
ncbi:MAG: hypothetical protein ACE37F_03165 [Nannocystaceae bacterium]|nr:hypothetical protein [bacterium]